MNDGTPTYKFPGNDTAGILDLCMVSATLATICYAKTTDDAYGSDHFLVLLTIFMEVDTVSTSSNRLRIGKVEWGGFYVKLDERKHEIENVELNCIKKYEQFTKVIVESLLDSGAYNPSNNKTFSPVKPSWWTPECDQAALKKKTARKEYSKNPNRNNLNKYIEIERETGKILANQKKTIFQGIM